MIRDMIIFIVCVLIIWALVMYFMFYTDHGKSPYTFKTNSISLSFNDGQSPPYTSDLLNLLKDNQVEAIFFVTAANAEKYSDLILEAVRNGNAVACLGLLPSEADVNRCRQAIYQIIGKNPICYRPTFNMTAEFQKFIETNQMVVIKPDLIIMDSNPNSIVSLTLGIIRPQSDLTLMSVKGDYSKQSPIAIALPTLIQKIKQMGITFQRRCFP